MANVDHFKQVNDTGGHQAGDAALHRFGSLLAARSRMADTVGHIGGEQFPVLIPGAVPAVALERARRLCDDVRKDARGWEHPITVSIGATRSTHAAIRPAELIAAADRALYAAKAAGRDRAEHAPAAPPAIAA